MPYNCFRNAHICFVFNDYLQNIIGPNSSRSEGIKRPIGVRFFYAERSICFNCIFADPEKRLPPYQVAIRSAN